MSVKLLTGWPSENVAGSAVTIVGTTEDADYPAAGLCDLNPAKPAKLTTSSGNWVWDFGAAQRIDWATLGPHNLTSATLQGNATNSWGAPTLSAAFVVPTAFRDGQSRHPWMDVTAKAGYSASGFRYWRLVVATASAPAAVGEVWLASRKREIPNLQMGARYTRMRPLVEHRTEYGISTVYDFGVLLRRLEGEFRGTTADAEAFWDLWHDADGRALIFPVVIDQSDTEAMFVRFSPEMTDERFDRKLSLMQPTFDEVGRGLRL